MNLLSLIPPDSGRPPKAGTPGGRWRRHMKALLATPESRRRCGYTQRWQSETVISMIKRNLGSALRGRTAHSRKRDMALKSLTHDLMVLAELCP
jgi:transposase